MRRGIGTWAGLATSARYLGRLTTGNLDAQGYRYLGLSTLVIYLGRLTTGNLDAQG